MTFNDLPQLGQNGEPEIYRILRMGSYANSGNESGKPEDLPIAEIKHKVTPETSAADGQEVVFTVPEKGALNQKKEKIESESKGVIKKVLSLMLYPAIFAGSFLVFYTAINFPSLADQAQAYFNNKTQDEQILGQDLTAYNNWISGYYYSVANKDILSANNDADKDGLTNYDEFVMKTNPTLADSDSDGTSDGVEVLNGSNPWGVGSMTSAQKKLRDQVNLISISDRISYNVSTNKGKTVTDDSNKFDLTRPGELSIPKLNIKVPLIFSPDPSTFDADLEKGVIHYPGTALPGQIGTMYVAGHSSDYIWKHDPMAHIFTTINHLSSGDDVFITVYGTDGKIYTYRYRVTTQRTYSPDDQTQFIDDSVAKLNLSTCWPIGSTKDRLVVSAELVGL